MTTTIGQLLHQKAILAKLKKDYPKGFPKFHGFTIQLHYGGNKSVDIPNITICSVSTKDEKNSEIFYNLLISEIESNIDFWTKAAEREIAELSTALNK